MIGKHYFLVLSLFLTACASNQWKSSEVDEVFVTDIKSSGLKIFNYSLTRLTSQTGGDGERGGSKGKGSGKHSGRGGKGGGKSGGHGGKGKSVADSGIKLYFNEMLEAKLKKSGYCRGGYIELDSFYGTGQLQIRGECEEGATEEDRIKFVNNESI